MFFPDLPCFTGGRLHREVTMAETFLNIATQSTFLCSSIFCFFTIHPYYQEVIHS